MKIQVVVGGQFGSEAKGHVAKQLVDDAVSGGLPVFNVRVAGPNAGHSAVDDTGHLWAYRSVPVGAVNRSPLVRLGIAAGSEIDLPVLLKEIDESDAAGLNVGHRLIVDPEATMLYDSHKETESPSGLNMHQTIGSTGKGIGAARADRIMRVGNRLGDDREAMTELTGRGVTVQSFHIEQLSLNTVVIVEGTQGYGLGLHAGHYPQCTSSDTRAIDFLAMAGVSPWSMVVDDFEVWVVARVYPIRVAGNSGPLVDESSWAELGLAEELTTVTHKVRRVGGWDKDLIHNAVLANGGAPVVRIALTMMDQKFPSTEGIYGDYYLDLISSPLFDDVEIADIRTFVQQVEKDAGADVRMITTSANTAVWVDQS